MPGGGAGRVADRPDNGPRAPPACERAVLSMTTVGLCVWCVAEDLDAAAAAAATDAHCSTKALQTICGPSGPARHGVAWPCVATHRPPASDRSGRLRSLARPSVISVWLHQNKHLSSSPSTVALSR